MKKEYFELSIKLAGPLLQGWYASTGADPASPPDLCPLAGAFQITQGKPAWRRDTPTPYSSPKPYGMDWMTPHDYGRSS